MKRTISIIVIVVALAGAGIFGYLSFRKPSAGPSLEQPIAADSSSTSILDSAGGAQGSAARTPAAGTSAPSPIGAGSQILPMGSNLKFDIVQKYNSNNRLFPYPVVNPSEIGVTPNEMVKQ